MMLGSQGQTNAQQAKSVVWNDTQREDCGIYTFIFQTILQIFSVIAQNTQFRVRNWRKQQSIFVP